MEENRKNTPSPKKNINITFKLWRLVLFYKLQEVRLFTTPLKQYTAKSL